MSEVKWAISETTAGKTVEIEIPAEAIRFIKAEGIKEMVVAQKGKGKYGMNHHEILDYADKLEQSDE